MGGATVISKSSTGQSARHSLKRLEKLTSVSTEPAAAQMSDRPADFVGTMLKAIVGVEIEITRLVGKSKLSQNKEVRDIRSVGEAYVGLGETDLGQAMMDAAAAKQDSELS